MERSRTNFLTIGLAEACYTCGKRLCMGSWLEEHIKKKQEGEEKERGGGGD